MTRCLISFVTFLFLNFRLCLVFEEAIKSSLARTSMTIQCKVIIISIAWGSVSKKIRLDSVWISFKRKKKKEKKRKKKRSNAKNNRSVEINRKKRIKLHGQLRPKKKKNPKQHKTYGRLTRRFFHACCC